MNLEITTPMRTLLCEDDGITVMQLRKALLLGGFDIVGEAMSGRKAIELALSLKPDLILMDINMPGSMNGISAAREIVQHRRRLRQRRTRSWRMRLSGETNNQGTTAACDLPRRNPVSSHTNCDRGGDRPA